MFTATWISISPDYILCFVCVHIHVYIIDLLQEVREMELLVQAKVKERDILKGFKVDKLMAYIVQMNCMYMCYCECRRRSIWLIR